jgi:hypothetical protein
MRDISVLFCNDFGIINSMPNLVSAFQIKEVPFLDISSPLRELQLTQARFKK